MDGFELAVLNFWAVLPKGQFLRKERLLGWKIGPSLSK
jgi:hypothetical protein